MGFLKDVFGSGDDPKLGFTPIPQTPEATESRKRLFELAKGEPPEVPRQQIAPLPPVTEERETARATAKELVQPQDFMSLPEVQAIIGEAKTTGNILANRVGRMLKSAGALTSTPGRDILGRTVKQVEQGITSQLAPFAMEDRARRERMIPILEQLGLTEEERERAISQAELSAIFQQELTESQQLETFTIPLLKSIINLQPGVQPTVEKEGLSTASSIGKALMPVLSTALLSSLMGGGGTAGGQGSNVAISGSSFRNPQAVYGAPA